MKLMFWNLLNLGDTKLNKGLPQAIIGNAQMGNDFLDFIIKVASGDAVWQNATSQVAADVFVIVELKSGGKTKGANGSGACLQVLPRVVAAMDTAVGAPGRYASVTPLVIGFHEVVGVVYSTATLTFGQSAVLRNVQNSFLNPRSAFWVQFTENGNNNAPLNIVGIHGPTSQPTSGNYKNAVVFTNDLAKVAAISQSGNNPKQRLYIGGDFNVDPQNSYSVGNGNKKKKISAFDQLTSSYNYNITLPYGTLTSVRNGLDNNKTPPANYLSQPYDNIPFIMPGQAPLPVVRRVDIIGNAPTYAGHQVATFNAGRRLSDHLPMTIEW